MTEVRYFKTILIYLFRVNYRNGSCVLVLYSILFPNLKINNFVSALPQQTLTALPPPLQTSPSLFYSLSTPVVRLRSWHIDKLAFDVPFKAPIDDVP